MKFNEQLENLLKTLDKFIDKEGNLLKQNVKDSSEKFDNDLIKLLLNDKASNEHFFDKIDNATIFNYRKFIDYIDDKNFLIDSYTKFSNKVGLTISNKHIKQIDDVVLSFPFKDCVLEGGQSKDDEKRKEIFFNEVLAKDEINRLLDKKVICNAQKYRQDGLTEEVKFTRDAQDTIKDNLIIKGNNLLALHTLKSNFAGKVKLIYIDPPYNTGNDSFNYNDNFNHSTWLTFMKNRLEVARDLLADDGVIFVQCDDNEQAYLKVLMDEVFGRGNFIANFPRVTKKGGKSSDFIAKNHDYIIIFSKIQNLKLNKFKHNDSGFNLKDEHFEDRGYYKQNQTLDYDSIQYSPSLDYVIEFDKKTFRAGNTTEEERLKRQSKNPKTAFCWRWSKPLFEFGVKNGFIALNKDKTRIYTKTYQNSTISQLNKNYFIEKIIRDKPTSTLELTDNKYSNDNSKKELSNIMDKDIFSYPKSEVLLKTIIELSTKKAT